MKLSRLLPLILTLTLIYSCSKSDSSPVEAEQNNDEEIIEDESTNQEPPEIDQPEYSDAASTISNNVIIKGSEKIDGILPTPNEAITLDVSEVNSKGFLNEGFNIPVSSNADIVGAYIQFKTKDGGLSKSYYKVNFELNKSIDTTNFEDVSFKQFDIPKKLSFKENSFAIDVDFNSNIEPGEFCYSICVFDKDGNISGAEEICVTVLNWGGNDELVGTWNYYKDVRNYTDWGTVERIVGSNLCYKPRTWYCAEGGSFQYSNCHGWLFLKVTYNADGTYERISESYGQYVIGKESEVNCEPVYTTDAMETVKTTGTWSYDSEKEQLIQVQYTYEGENQNGPFSYIYDKGEGRLLWRSNVVTADNLFIFGEDYEYPIRELSGFRYFHSKE